MRLGILSWAAQGGGRAKALLSIANHCQANGFETTVYLGGGWRANQLESHHGIELKAQTERVTWDELKSDIERIEDEYDPDVLLAFDTLLIKACRQIDTPTIGYLRTQTVPGVEGYFAPSKQCAEKHTTELTGRDEPECKPVYPIDYLESDLGPPLDERPIDILIHGRKLGDPLDHLSGSYNILLANSFSYPELKGYYKQSKLFLFPKKERFEPLGLMPIEAVAHGCNIGITENSGVAEIYPEYAYEKPSTHVDKLLTMTQDTQIPASPTEIASELRRVV